MIRPTLHAFFAFVLWAVCFASGIAAAQTEDEAYEYNREGMILMSQADFEEAAEAFKNAADLVLDYQIRGRALMYTPVFMTAWAYEKIGRVPDACEQYRRFLRIAPPEAVEETKADHARGFLNGNCG